MATVPVARLLPAASPISRLSYVGSQIPVSYTHLGETAQTMLYWPYDEDGWYYAAFDNDGFMVVASARIAQYS